jgi:hypothetical protein
MNKRKTNKTFTWTVYIITFMALTVVAAIHLALVVALI